MKKTLSIVLLLSILVSCNNFKKNVELGYSALDNPNEYSLNFYQDVNIDMTEQPMNAERSIGLTYILNSEIEGSQIKSNIEISETEASLIMAVGKQLLDTRNIPGTFMHADYTIAGKEMNISDNLDFPVIDFGPMGGGQFNWMFLLKYAFPVLPEVEINTGDTWNKVIFRKQTEGSLKVDAKIQVLHKIVGFKKVQGYDCIQVESEIIGSMEDKIDQGEMSWQYKGEIKRENGLVLCVQRGYLR